MRIASSRCGPQSSPPAAAACRWRGGLLVAHEAPFLNEDSPRPSADPVERIRQLVGEGRRSEAVAFWMSDVVGMPGEMLAQMDGAPWVKALEPLTPTLPYDLAVTAGGVPAAELGKITAPVLILGGRNSPPWFRRSVAEQAAATPGAQLSMLDGFDHNAPVEVIAPILTDFFDASRSLRLSHLHTGRYPVALPSLADGPRRGTTRMPTTRAPKSSSLASRPWRAA